MSLRDPALEALWRQQLASQIAAYHGDPVEPFDRLIVQRIEQGQAQFGDAWANPAWDGLAEALEEAADIPVYMLLQTQQDQLTGAGGGTRSHHMLAAATHAGLADWHVRQAQRAT